MYTLLKPEVLGYTENEILNPKFIFSLEGVEEEILQYYLDNNIISNGND